MLEATQLHPPRIGPQFPVNPWIVALVRPYADTSGGNVYPAYAAQWNGGTPTPILRDRVSCYLWGPNGELLDLQWYGAILIGSYAGLPLYATWCCGNGDPLPPPPPTYPDVLTVNTPTGPTTVVLTGGGGSTPPVVTYTGTITDTPPDTPLTAILTFTNVATMVTTTVTAVITGGPGNPFAYTYNGPLPVLTPGVYKVTATVTSFTGNVVTSSFLTITVLAGSSSSSAGLVPNCAHCVTSPARWAITVAGVTNNSCIVCNAYNGSWTLVHNPTPAYTLSPGQQIGCVWDSGDVDPCEGGYPSWVFYTDGTNWFLLMAGGYFAVAQVNAASGGGAAWSLADFLFTCNTGNVLPLGGNGSECSTPPATITIVPA